MDKPILFYEVRPQTNRTTGDTIYVSAIVEREESHSLTNYQLKTAHLTASTFVAFTFGAYMV